MDSNVVYSSTSKGAELSSSKRRKTFVEHSYPMVIPVEYHLEASGHTIIRIAAVDSEEVPTSETELRLLIVQWQLNLQK
ncbi:unnamed protein product [Pleuronectes platessa]|uniref:Uncharacterized protein n=1 Tax=Pleuronectes platessa TaxID=8262 RepID=A0A9N7YNM4_PLEPL|nr:unnamed protein product [Pleuronectes platessa]